MFAWCLKHKIMINLIQKTLEFILKAYVLALGSMSVMGIFWAIYALISGEFTNANFGIME